MRPRATARIAAVVAALGATSIVGLPAPTSLSRGIGARADSSSSRPRAAERPSGRADASVLFNAGTNALARGDLGSAVAFLLAARRLDPRAPDIRLNLAIARARVEDVQGPDGDRGRLRPPSAFALSSAEGWWLAAALAAAGALLAWGAALRAPGRGWTRAGAAAVAIAVALSGGLALNAREERLHPQAVVVAPVLEVGPAQDEPPRAPYLLGAGEEVRLDRARGDWAEVRVSGNAVGWARRSGLWRVDEAPRYTSEQRSR